MSQIYNPYGPIGIDPVTTTTTTCNASLVSVTLSAGQSFILPPGATLVGASDVTKLQSDCADLLNLEQLGCYACAIPIGGNSGGSEAAFWEADAPNGVVSLTGYRFNQLDASFNPEGIQINSDVGRLDLPAITSQLQNALPGIIAIGYHWVVKDGNRGAFNCILIKTFPSIANNLYLIARTSLPASQPNSGAGYFSFAPKDDYSGWPINWSQINC